MSNQKDTPKDPLDDLFVKKEEINRELLARLLVSYVKIYVDKDTPEIVLTKETQKLNIREKLLIYLLARKAIVFRLGEEVYTEYVSPMEIEKETGLKGGSIRPLLRQLLDERLVANDANEKGYYVPTHAIENIVEMLEKNK
jgi:hypothetical protein